MLSLFRKRWNFDSRRYPLACWRVPFITGSDGSSSLRLFFPPFRIFLRRVAVYASAATRLNSTGLPVQQGIAIGTLRASLSGTFLHTARTGYATEGALIISAQLSTDTVSALRKVLVMDLLKLQALVYDILPSILATLEEGTGKRCSEFGSQTPSTGLRHPSFNHCRI